MCINNKNDYNNKSYDNDNEKKRTRKKKYINIKNKKNKKDIVNKNMFYRNNLIYNTNEEFNESNRHSIYYSNGKNINSSNILFLLTYKTKVLYEDKYNIFLNENNNIFMPNIKEENEWFLNMNNIYFMIKSREVKKSYKIIFKELLINITIDNIKELYKLYNNFRYNIYFASFYKNYFSFFKNIYIHPFKNKNQSLLKKSSEKLEIQNIYLRNMHKFKMLKNHIIYNKLKQMSKNKIYRINKNKYIYQQEIEGNKKFSFQMNKNKYIHKNNNCDIYYSDNENDNLDIISSNQNDRHYKYVNRNKMKKRRNVQNNKIGKDKKNKSKDTEREKLIYSIKNTKKLENIESQKCTNKDNKILYTSFSNKNEIFNVQDKYTYKERKHIKDISKKGNEKMKGNLYNLIKRKTIYEHNWEENQYNYNNINTLYYARRRFLISNMNIYKKMVDSYIKIQPLINLENTNRKYFEIIYNIKEKYTEIELYKENLYNLYNQIFLIINNINNEKNIICHGLIFLKLLNCFYPYNNNYIRNLLYYLFVFSKYNKFAYYLCNIKKYFHYNYFLTFTKILHTNDIWNDIHINQKTNNNSKAFYKTSQEYYSLQKDTKHVPIILNTNQRINENISIHKEITENFKKEGMFKENSFNKDKNNITFFLIKFLLYFYHPYKLKYEKGKRKIIKKTNYMNKQIRGGEKKKGRTKKEYGGMLNNDDCVSLLKRINLKNYRKKRNKSKKQLLKQAIENWSDANILNDFNYKNKKENIDNYNYNEYMITNSELSCQKSYYDKNSIKKKSIYSINSNDNLKCNIINCLEDIYLNNKSEKLLDQKKEFYDFNKKEKKIKINVDIHNICLKIHQLNKENILTLNVYDLNYYLFTCLYKYEFLFFNKNECVRFYLNEKLQHMKFEDLYKDNKMNECAKNVISNRYTDNEWYDISYSNSSISNNDNNYYETCRDEDNNIKKPNYIKMNLTFKIGLRTYDNMYNIQDNIINPTTINFYIKEKFKYFPILNIHFYTTSININITTSFLYLYQYLFANLNFKKEFNEVKNSKIEIYNDLHSEIIIFYKTRTKNNNYIWKLVIINKNEYHEFPCECLYFCINKKKEKNTINSEFQGMNRNSEDYIITNENDLNNLFKNISKIGFKKQNIYNLVSKHEKHLLYDNTQSVYDILYQFTYKMPFLYKNYDNDNKIINIIKKKSSWIYIGVLYTDDLYSRAYKIPNVRILRHYVNTYIYM